MVDFVFQTGSLLGEVRRLLQIGGLMRPGRTAHVKRLICADVMVILGAVATSAAGLVFPGGNPGSATATVKGNKFYLANRVLEMEWHVVGRALKPGYIRNKIANETVSLEGGVGFAVVLADGTVMTADDLRIVEAPHAVRLVPTPAGSRFSERMPGWKITALFGAPDGRYDVDWQLILRDGANAVRQQITLRAKSAPVQFCCLRLIDLPLSGARVAGVVPGSPVVAGNFFAACEHPEAVTHVA
ncbi:MAG: hypothetical protein N3G20_00395, partial [Verrucomicrobiae bacterium]|nr:hypothetical protein [Verrucomicrobiae bacterium]